MIVRVRRLAPRAATLLVLHLIFAALTSGEEKAARWSEQAANDWYKQQAWLVGSNYVPAYAINQLEMWQAETFDPAQIDREMGWAESIGMNTMRVFLHDLLWQQDADGFSKRIDQFLQVADRHHIKPMFVLFDSCWDPNPKLGLQHPPVPGVHNSGWVQSPGAAALADPAQEARLRDYVRGVVAAFAKDSRILAWDVWNEPSNLNEGSYSQREPTKKLQIVEGLLPKVFQWAREAHPSQPLTSGLWDIDFEHEAPLSRMQQIQVENSDIFSFHNYGWPESFEQEVVYLEKFHRPILCTEYMARSAGSTFDTVLPLAQKHNVAAINWGLVEGKTQTYYPWESWRHPYIVEHPPVWFHDVFHQDGRPYREAEADLIRRLTGRGTRKN